MPPVQTNRPGALRLPDGRRLTFVETGPRRGRPVIYCHGAIGSPLRDMVNLLPLTERLNVRHIAVNRPGFGGADPVRARTVTAFAHDLTALADVMELERFYVIGVSAGGPYALAVAHALRSRVIRAAVCSSLSPLPAPAARRHRRPCGAHPARATRRRRERQAAGASFLSATAYGVGGMIEDYLTYSRGWGFRPQDVEPEVQVWHGGLDPLVPIEHALQLAVSLPACRIFVDPDEGHHFFRRRLEEIMTVLLNPDRGPQSLAAEGARALLADRVAA
jgi:pimeloyl-ACP methyl ester carboxylesterase